MTELLGAVPPLGNATAHFPTIVHPRQPSHIWADATAPLPTNEWWQDLVLEESGANAVTMRMTLWTAQARKPRSDANVGCSSGKTRRRAGTGRRRRRSTLE